MAVNDFAMKAVPEWVGHDPFGKIKKTDRSSRIVRIQDGSGTVALHAAKNGYVSFRLLVRGKGEYRLKSAIEGLEIDLFRAWYHRRGRGKSKPLFITDALIPVRTGEKFRLPDPNNRIPGQKAQEFWVDIYVPGNIKAGTYSGSITLSASGAEKVLDVRISVLKHSIPDSPTLQIDHNSYGYSVVPAQYPKAFSGVKPGKDSCRKIIEILHHYYRLFHEHRGLFHNLPYGHSGNVFPPYAPQVRGSGRDLRLVNWDMYDRHYGPLLEGTVFRKPAPGMPGPRRSPDPIWGVYTPFNPEWPSDYVKWGEEGYEVEFQAGLKQFDAHLRKKGWTKSYVEMFFNHKKRYRWFEWDGDEPKYAKDFDHISRMGDMFHAVTRKSPVKWVYRADVSWQMKEQWNVHRNNINFFVCSSLMRWYRRELNAVLKRNDIVWGYGSLPNIQQPSASILEFLYRTWILGISGFTPWSSISVGRDPWFNFDGGGEGLAYPGERFSIPGPLPSIRLKIERNGIQDVDLINTKNNARQLSELKKRLRKKLPVRTWEPPPRAARELPPEDWNNINLNEDVEPSGKGTLALDSQWWQELRRIALGKKEGL